MIQMAGGGRINLKTGEPYGIDLEEVDNGQHDENRELDYISGSCAPGDVAATTVLDNT